MLPFPSGITHGAKSFQTGKARLERAMGIEPTTFSLGS